MAWHNEGDMIILERWLDHDKESDKNAPLGCFGSIYIDGVFYCNTVEQPWRQNRRFVSCVPVGVYDLVAYDSPKYGKTYALSNPDLDVVVYQADADEGQRYACLFHAANWSRQLQGCIAPGKDLAWGKTGVYKPNLMVTESRNTLAKLLPLLENEELLIRWKHQR